jgi:hypothetical protein
MPGFCFGAVFLAAGSFSSPRFYGGVGRTEAMLLPNKEARRFTLTDTASEKSRIRRLPLKVTLAR